MRKIKDILRLRHEAGLAYRAIANALNIGYGTVVDYLNRAQRAGLGWPVPEGLPRVALLVGSRQCANGQTWQVLLTTEYLRTAVRFRTTPPIYKGQPLSVGLFLCGVLRVCGGFCGNLRTSPPRRVARSRPDSALFCPSSLAPSRVKNLKSASTEISLVTNQWLTRGLFKRLDGVIA